jgi:adenosylmethionine-8-amino-7-oxononanoate aminotransferase
MEGADRTTNALNHLLYHFTDLSAYQNRPIPEYVRGDGCYVYDSHGRRYIDGLSGLFCTSLGHSFGAEIGEAAREQLATLPYMPNWYMTHPPANQLAAKIASLAPGDLNRVFFTNGGAEANEAAYKLARQWHANNGQPSRHKVIARKVAYHGASVGAMSFTGLTGVREPFEPIAIPTRFVSNTNAYRHRLGHDEDAYCADLLAEIEEVIEFEGPHTIAMLIAEPVQNGGGCLTPPRGYWQGLREICDREGILLVSDEVICGFGRLGEWFGAIRYGFQPDIITFAKGVTAGHAPLGGAIVSDRIAAPFVSGEITFMHGLTFGAHPLSCAIANKAIEIMEREAVLDNVRRNEPLMRRALDDLMDIDIVGNIRGAGHFWAIELVKSRDTKETFVGAEADWLLRQVLTDRLTADGLICRVDDRGEPVVQLAPPLVAGMPLFHDMVAIVRDALEHAWRLVKDGELDRRLGAAVLPAAA